MGKNLLVINVDIREVRVALIENGIIAELHIERDSQKGTLGNIYLGKVSRVLPGMQAAFIDVGLERAAFLHVEDLIRPDDFEAYLAGNKGRGTAAATDEDRSAMPSAEDAAEQEAAAIERERRDQELEEAQAAGPEAAADVPVVDAPAEEGADADAAEIAGADDGGGRQDDRDLGDADHGAYDDHHHDHDRDGGEESEEDREARLDRQRDAEIEDEDEPVIALPTALDVIDDNGGLADEEPLDKGGAAEGVSAESGETSDSDEAGDRATLENVGTALAPGGEGGVPIVGGEGTEAVPQEPRGRGRRSRGRVRRSASTSERRATGGEARTDAAPRDTVEMFDRPRADAPSDPGRGRPAPAARADRGAPGERTDQRSDRGGRSRGGRGRDQGSRDQGRDQGRNDRGGRGGGRDRGREGDRRDGRGRDAGRRGGSHHEPPRVSKTTPIREVVREGQEVIVQISKEPIGTKGARVTSHVSLPGRYVVYLPTVDHVGISKRIGSERERIRLRETMEAMKPPTGGLIVRTLAEGLTKKQLKADVGYLVRLWGEVAKKREETKKAPNCLYTELDLVLKTARDLFTEDIEKIVIDSNEEYTRLKRFVETFLPERANDVELYDGEEPIFDAYGIEDEIQRAQSRKVPLASGGHLILDQAEALTAIDVNTGRFVGKGSKDLEDTILITNLEAVEEIAYQLRFRNIGGLIILDLIDMDRATNREKVRKKLEELLAKDKAKTTLNRISDLGLIEMTRKRTRESLGRTVLEPCFYCDGTGQLQSKQTIAYEILRQIRRERMNLPGYKVVVNAHPAVVDLFKSDERIALQEAEKLFQRRIELVARKEYHLEQFDLQGK